MEVCLIGNLARLALGRPIGGVLKPGLSVEPDVRVR
jgi:hypothetical protein